MNAPQNLPIGIEREESATFNRATIDYIRRAATTGLYEIRGLGEQRAAPGDRARDGFGHRQLLRPQSKSGKGARQRAGGAEDRRELGIGGRRGIDVRRLGEGGNQ